MSNEEILKSSGLWQKDLQNGKEGYTLAAAVLLGKETTIQSILPHYKTDAILRVDNVDRYDDRDDIRCNLINAYSRLLSFVQKHLPDKFYMEGTQRVSLRDKIFREIITNLLIHREFTNHFPAKLIIEADKVYTENGNKSHGNGQIDPANFSPFPKNPNIAKFFKEIGWVDELGSGIRNTTRLLKDYYGKGKPQFIEGDNFNTIIPVAIPKLSYDVVFSSNISVEVFKKLETEINETIIDGVNDGVVDGVSDGVKSSLTEVIQIINSNSGINANNISTKITKSKPTTERYLKILKSLGVIEFKGAPKTGGYHLTEEFKRKLEND